MIITSKYFGMIAERIGISEERFTIELSDDFNLRNYYEIKYPVLSGLNYKIAVNQELTETIKLDQESIEVALLPPFAGG